jgi:hypothetical protein
MAAYRAEPTVGVQALVLEHIAVSLNLRQGLAAGERLSGILAASGQHHDVTAAFTAELDRMPWQVYDVRRMIRPCVGDPAKAANASRSLRTRASGSRPEMTAALRQLAKAVGAVIDSEDGIERAGLHRRGATFPAAEHFLVAARPDRKTRKAPASRRPGKQPPRPSAASVNPPRSFSCRSPGRQPLEIPDQERLLRPVQGDRRVTDH